MDDIPDVEPDDAYFEALRQMLVELEQQATRERRRLRSQVVVVIGLLALLAAAVTAVAVAGTDIDNVDIIMAVTSLAAAIAAIAAGAAFFVAQRLAAREAEDLREEAILREVAERTVPQLWIESGPDRLDHGSVRPMPVLLRPSTRRCCSLRSWCTKRIESHAG